MEFKLSSPATRAGTKRHYRGFRRTTSTLRMFQDHILPGARHMMPARAAYRSAHGSHSTWGFLPVCPVHLTHTFNPINFMYSTSYFFKKPGSPHSSLDFPDIVVWCHNQQSTFPFWDCCKSALTVDGVACHFRNSDREASQPALTFCLLVIKTLLTPFFYFIWLFHKC